MFVLGIQGEPKTATDDGDPTANRSSGWYHDAAAVLLENGNVVAAIEEERLIRHKHSGRFPIAAIAFCLNEANICLDNVGLVAYGERGGIGPHLDPRISVARIDEILRRAFGCASSLASRIRLVEHHLAHAIGAYVCSGFEESLVLTADGFGDGVAGYVASMRDGVLTVLDRIDVANSLGRFYSAPLHVFGFDAFSEYKVMGLAPYGDPARFRGDIRRMYALSDDGTFAFAPVTRTQRLDDFSRLVAPRHPGEPLGAQHCDLAAALQEALEDILRHVLRHFRRTTGHEHLCFSGGTAQNCAAAGKLLAENIFDDIFVQPASTDAGNALGAAYYAALCEQGSPDPPRRAIPHVFLGGDLPAHDVISNALAGWHVMVESSRSSDVCADTAALLAGGHVVAWMQGRSEFGPRALGHRSILADPRPAANKIRINAMIKKREAFRPFAPSVLEEHAADYFDFPGPPNKIYPFMTFVVPVREEKRELLGAVTHVDGTARVQTVSKTDNATYWSLIDRFARLTGVPVLLNTSFNNHVEPIVETVQDAITCFLTTDLEHLIIGNLIVRKKGTQEQRIGKLIGLWAQLARGAVVTRISGCLEDTSLCEVRRANRQTPISMRIARILSCEDRVARVEEIVGTAASTVEREHILRELHALWSERFIVMRPTGG